MGRHDYEPGEPIINGNMDTTRERILHVAENLFAKKGFYETSLRDICSVIGIANSSLLYYFPSKKKLYGAVLRKITESLSIVTADLPTESGNPERDISIIMQRLMDWARNNPGRMQILMRETLDNPERLPEIKHFFLSDLVKAMRQPIDRIKEKGGLQGFDPDLFLFHFIGAVSYFSVALPTISHVIQRSDAEELQRKYEETILNVITSCIQNR
ncbi:MAG: TetR/AcrR family transcriptional regulator [Bacillota bacterium]